MSDIVLSGMRPTGDLHIGHYVGVIKNWIGLQDKHQCFFFVADWHAMTSNHEEVDVVNKSRREYVRGWLACGIDPNKVVIYNQSSIPEILNLSQIFLCLTPPGWADRSPSWKDMKEHNFQKKLDNLGFYTYPILQAADVAIVHGKYVPVGEDQVSHIEISREIVRKFNRTYKTNLPEPEALLTEVPKLEGLGGKKMSSSLGNTISLRETPKSLQKKINKIKTDDTREGIDAPGNPENCSIYDYHKVFSSKEDVQIIDQHCRGAKLGCGVCKQKLGDSMKEELMPIAEKMNTITDEEVDIVLRDGIKKAKKVIVPNWENLQEKIGFYK
ncbi:MAG: tryptophan--tRNA ligase [Bacteriovoracaceae bacterium]|nr:tryptophan--tRNA ligase [Bacteriovoracaceae bacterium]